MTQNEMHCFLFCFLNALTERNYRRIAVPSAIIADKQVDKPAWSLLASPSKDLTRDSLYRVLV